MTEKQPISVETKYDDITANLLHADERYAYEQPTFEEFAAVYEMLVENFYHNAALAKVAVVSTQEEMLNVSTGVLRAKWEQSIRTWFDVEDYIDAWIQDRLQESDGSADVSEG